ncbi:SpoIIE family protein phosphatase [Desulfovermiculus halophilus]|jgi:sigma-B regulation protein RsbU (phosphoserine phosphatase)|uniref:SpoIIE family protein phosphatase n=1 Tax=Desulfovermiculus halophilus TaxID=339722 RepID=UPI000556656A|nr:SpoIIE family protein phosphatase [Desulfovermiculus halophilus]
MQNNEIKILIIDDSPVWRDSLNSIFEGQNYQLRMAEDGHKALQEYREFKPNILILDLNLPCCDGKDIIRSIRNQVGDNDLYIISLTSVADVETKTQALNLGSNDFLVKTFDHEELKARINVAKRQIRLNKQLRAAFERIAQEFDTVASLQNKLIPKSCYYTQDLAIQSAYYPSGRASGDYYDFFSVQNNILRVVIADVSGHGARAAFLMGIVRALARTTEVHYLDLAQTFDLINTQLIDILGQEMDFVTMFAADIDQTNNVITYINAGHCPGLIVSRNNHTDLLEPTSTILGFFDLEFQPVTLDISESCGLFLFTDGYYEWMVSPTQRFGLTNFLNLASELLCTPHFSMETLEAQMVQGLDGRPSFPDDRSALWIHWKNNGP